MYAALQTFRGGSYVNDFSRFGPQWRVFLQADMSARMKPDDIAKLHVRNAHGDMVPLSSAQLFIEQCTGWILQRNESVALSPRQRQTLQCLLEGNCAKQIASKLGLSLYTVKEYVQQVYRANGVASQPELMARYLAPPTRRSANSRKT